MVAQRPLHLCGMPIALARASQEHVDSMLAAAEQAITAGGGGLSTSLALTVRSLSDEYSDIAAGMEATLDAAEAAGESAIDFEFEAPLTMASAAETWLRLLEHLEDLAAAGQFDHQTTPADVQAYRKWLVDEIVDQLRDGRPPVAFAEAGASAGT